MLSIKYTGKMKRDVKRAKKRGKDIEKLITALDLLAVMNQMPVEYRDHALKGEMQGFRECHIEPDWLLIYQISHDTLTLIAYGTGSYADLFDV